MQYTNRLFEHSDAQMKFRSKALSLPAKLTARHVRNQQGSSPPQRSLLSSCHIGFLNVCSLRSSFDVGPDGLLVSEGDEALEMLKLHMRTHHLYALALSEVRLPHSGSIDIGSGFLLIYSGSPGDGALGGVAFVLSPAAAAAWRLGGCRAEHVSSGRLLRISLSLDGHEGLWHLVSVYGPTMQCLPQVKEQFWTDFHRLFVGLPAREVAFAVGDFNCRVGSRSAGDFPAPVLGPFGLGPRNGNGLELLHRAVAYELTILSTFFQHDLQHTASWWHRRWRTPGLIDLAVTRCCNRRFVTDVHSLPGVEVLSDHNLMIFETACLSNFFRQFSLCCAFVFFCSEATKVVCIQATGSFYVGGAC